MDTLRMGIWGVSARTRYSRYFTEAHDEQNHPDHDQGHRDDGRNMTAGGCKRQHQNRHGLRLPFVLRVDAPKEREVSYTRAAVLSISSPRHIRDV